MRSSDWSSDVCSSDLPVEVSACRGHRPPHADRGAGGRRRVLRPVGQGRGHPGHGPGHGAAADHLRDGQRSEEHTSELQSLMRISYAVFCLKKKKTKTKRNKDTVGLQKENVKWNLEQAKTTNTK